MRGACRIAPQEAFQIAAEWLQYQATTPIDTGGSKCKYLKLDLYDNRSIGEQADLFLELLQPKSVLNYVACIYFAKTSDKAACKL